MGDLKSYQKSAIFHKRIYDSRRSYGQIGLVNPLSLKIITESIIGYVPSVYELSVCEAL